MAPVNGSSMEWKKPTAIALLLLAALLTGNSAWTAPDADAVWWTKTDGSQAADIIEVEASMRGGSHDIVVPALPRMGYIDYSPDGEVRSTPDDLTATLNVYILSWEDRPRRDYVESDRIFTGEDGFRSHSIEFEGADSLVWFVWEISGGSEQVRDDYVDMVATFEENGGTPFGAGVVAIDQTQRAWHQAMVALSAMALVGSATLTLLPRKEPQFSATVGNIGGASALAEHGRHWLTSLRNAYAVVASTLIVSLVLYAWLVLQWTATVIVSEWAGARSHPFAGWGMLMVVLVAAICVVGLLLAGREVWQAQSRLQRWESKAAPIEGELE